MEQNVVSQAAWMARAIAENVVICVLSEDFVEHFGRATESSAHRGVRFESFLIIQKYYDYCESTHCPIIPVADWGFAAESAPAVLAGIPISRLGEELDDGIEEIVRRIRLIEGAAPSPLPAPRELPEIVKDLERVGNTATSGPDLVREWLRCLLGAPLDAGEFVGTFSAVENVTRGSVSTHLRIELDRRTQRPSDDPPPKPRRDGHGERSLTWREWQVDAAMCGGLSGSVGRSFRGRRASDPGRSPPGRGIRFRAGR